MRESAFGLGVAGGIVGFIAAMFEFFIDALGQATNANGASTVSGLAWLAFVAAVLGIVGGALAISKSRAAAGMMLAACVAGFAAASVFWVIAGVLLLVGALLSFLAYGTRSKPELQQLADFQPPSLRVI